MTLLSQALTETEIIGMRMPRSKVEANWPTHIISYIPNMPPADMQPLFRG